MPSERLFEEEVSYIDNWDSPEEISLGGKSFCVFQSETWGKMQKDIADVIEAARRELKEKDEQIEKFEKELREEYSKEP